MSFLRFATLVVAAATTTAVVAAPDGDPRIHRLVRVYDWSTGFPWSYVSGVEQDRRGFLWVTATSGLYRFDGTRALRVSGGLGVAPGGTAAGRVIATSPSGGVFEATADGLVRLDRGPGDEKDAGSVSVAVASDGTPWRVRDGAVERLDTGGAWAAVGVPAAPDDPPLRVSPGGHGRVYVISRSKVWAVEPDGSSRLMAPVDRVLLVAERADGTVVAGTNQAPGPVTTRLFELAGGAARPVYEERGARLLSMVERGDTLWVSMDKGLQALGPGYRPADRITSPAIPTDGNLVVDREGSLWMATARGLVQIPEPDVYAVLPSRGLTTRDIARTAHGVWGTFWGELAFLSDAPGPVRLLEAGEHFTALCRDGGDRVWTAGSGGMLRLNPDGSRAPVVAGRWEPQACGDGGNSRRWIVSHGRDLWTVRPDEDLPRPVPLHFDDDIGLTFAGEATDGTLWLARGSTMCGAPAATVLSGKTVSWRCERIADGHDVVDLQSMPSGDVWALTGWPGSIRRRAGGTWETIPGSERLGVSWLNAISPSPSGGVWLVGQGIVVRVGERPDLPDGWEVLERPTIWNGLITLNVVAIEEDIDGTLWLGTDVGIQRIPPDIRRRGAASPGVELVEGSVNGAPLDPTAPPILPYRRSRLETHFAALTFRDPAAVRYRMRLRDEDAWSAVSTDGHFTFVDLPPGRYDLEVAASLDGSRWSEPAAHLAFRVLRPWHAQPLVLGSLVLGAALGTHLLYRFQVHRRLAREKQRARIAMDLHDEVGSGLGTIAVLAGIAGRPDLPEDRRGDVAARIAAVSQELARSLGDIVWSLRTSSGSLDALWDQLLERARPLFASERPRIAFEAPDPVPHDALSLVVRRNLHLVAYEALHNAARHSGASLVVLRLARDGAGWRLEVEDDGRGLAEVPASPSVRRGLGIEAMKARVAEMGGTIGWDRVAAGGTRVSVRFRTGEG